MKKYLEYCRTDNYDDLLYNEDTKLIQSRISDFLVHIQTSGLLSGITTRYYAYTLKFFYEMNDITSLNWRKINKVMGERAKVANDRPYTSEEISRMLQKVDQRGRIIILLMCSSGMREGAIHSLKLAHLERIQDIYKITVYKNSPEEYITFCSPECTKAIDDYLSYRQHYGEVIKPYNPLIRKQFNKDSPEQAANVQATKAGNVRGIIYRALHDSGIREKVNVVKGQKKILHEVMQSHGLRKFFNTQVVTAGMNILYSEMLMGHKGGGLALQSYVKPTISQLYDEYINVIDSVTIDPNNRLEHENKQLKKRVTEMDELRLEIEKVKSKIGV